MGKKLTALLILAAMAALFFCGTASADPGETEPGWNRKGTIWYYFTENGTLLVNADTPDGYHTDAQGRFAGNAVGSGPFPVIIAEQQEEAPQAEPETDAQPE